MVNSLMLREPTAAINTSGTLEAWFLVLFLEYGAERSDLPNWLMDSLVLLVEALNYAKFWNFPKAAFKLPYLLHHWFNVTKPFDDMRPPIDWTNGAHYEKILREFSHAHVLYKGLDIFPKPFSDSAFAATVVDNCPGAIYIAWRAALHPDFISEVSAQAMIKLSGISLEAAARPFVFW